MKNNREKSFLKFLLLVLGVVVLVFVGVFLAKADFRQELISLFSAYSTVEINTQPKGEKVEVFLDDIYQGETPLILKKIKKGEYTLSFEKQDFEKQEEKIELVSGEKKGIVILLAEKNNTENEDKTMVVMRPMPKEKKTKEEFVDWISYQDNKYRFSFSYPEKFSLQFPSDFAYLTLCDNTYHEEKTLQIDVYVGEDDYPEKSLKEIANKKVEICRAGAGCGPFPPEVKGEGLLGLKEVPVLILSGSTPFGTEGMGDYLHYQFRNEGNLYTLELRAKNSQADLQIEKILKSFSFEEARSIEEEQKSR